MGATPSVHVTGARAWERCDREGALRGVQIDGYTEGIRLVTDQEDPDTGALPEAWWSAWRARRGGAIWRPLGPDRCETREALLASEVGLLRWDGQRWEPIPGLYAGPAGGVELDADGCLWVLAPGAGSLLRYGPLDDSPLTPVEVPPGLQQFTLCADGLLGIDGAKVWWRRDDRWEAIPLPDELTALGTVEITRWGDGAAVLLRGGGRVALAVIRRGRVEHGWVDRLDAALGLIALPDGDLLVGELVAAGETARMRFGRYRRDASGAVVKWRHLEVWRAIGFDGRALFCDADGQPWATTTRGPRRIYRQPDTYVGSLVTDRTGGVAGELVTWVLDAGTPATPWHRVFLDVELPEGTALRLYARSYDSEESSAKNAWIPVEPLDRRPGRADRPFPPLDPPPFETLEGLLPTWPGRYLRLKIELIGTRRASPLLHGVRVILPRPSLLSWLPAFWRTDTETLPEFSKRNDTAWGRLERLLALYEGPLTELEARADALPSLWDPSATPAEVLPWLAGLIGWTLDTRLGAEARRQLLLEAASLHRQRGTVLGIQRLCAILAGCKAQVVEAFRQRRQTGAVLGRETAGAHDSPGAVLGPGLTLAEGGAGDPSAWYAETAHRFSVMLYRDEDPDVAGMVSRAVEDYRPAHTVFDLVWLGSGLRPGIGSFVGLSTVPGPSEQGLGVEPLILGSEATPLGGRLDAGPTVLPHPSSLTASLPAMKPDKHRSRP